MALLNDEVRSQVAHALESPSRPVRARLFVRAQGCELCEEARQLLEEIREAAPGVELEVLDLDGAAEAAAGHGVEGAPAIVLLTGGDGAWADARVRFDGIPAGSEFTSLIRALQLLGRGDSQLAGPTREALAGLRTPVEIQVFVTPTCPYCPQAVVLAHQMAMESPWVRATMVEATSFPERARRQGVSGVPHSVINDQAHVVGAVPEAHLLAEVLRAAAPAAAA